MSASTYLQAPPKRKLLGFAGVVVLHALLFWAIQAGLTRTVVQKMPLVVQAILLDEIKPALPPSTPPPPAPPTPPAPPKKTPPPAYVPPAVTPAVTAPVNAIAAVSAAPAPAPAAAAPASPVAAATTAAPVRTAAGVNMAQCEKPAYPSSSRRMEEEGTVSLRFLVGTDGKVIQSEVEKSSGFPRLDQAARTSLSKCQFKPATVDGKAEQSWANIRYTWRLE